MHFRQGSPVAKKFTQSQKQAYFHTIALMLVLVLPMQATSWPDTASLAEKLICVISPNLEVRHLSISTSIPEPVRQPFKPLTCSILAHTMGLNEM